MAGEIKPGQWITVKVKSQPKAAAGRKTLVRLAEQDPKIKRERERLARSRPVGGHRRGGRIWADRPPRVNIVEVKPGATYRIFGSVDVLRDLKSIDRYVELTPA